MPKLKTIPDFFCCNCGKKIDVSNPHGCCDNEECQVDYRSSFEIVTRQEAESGDRKGWAYYLLAKSFTSNCFGQMVASYWDAAFLGNRDAKRELANLFDENDDELSLETSVFLSQAIDGDWPKEYLKKIREKEPQKLFEIALEFETNLRIENHREYAYKFYRKAISSRGIIGIWEAKAIVNLVQMLLFDRFHYDGMFLEKSFHEPQLGVEIAFWLSMAKQEGDDETKAKANELAQKAKNYFSNKSWSNFFDMV